ncbi:MAG: hypothetical protein N2588_03565 [Rhodovarius sp.]|nr:hypothetical protein [Rhodovarius sp.]
MRLLDVVWPHDHLAKPPTWKMWAAVSVRRGWFLRINSRGDYPGSVRLLREDHPFLDHDSYLGCGGDLIVVDDYALAEALERQSIPARQGICGRINLALVPEIIVNIQASDRLTGNQKRQIVAELGEL